VEVEGVAAHLDGLGVLQEAERSVALSEKARETLVRVEGEERRLELTGPTTRAMAEKLRTAAAISCASMARGRGEPASRGGGDGTAASPPCCLACSLLQNQFAVLFSRVRDSLPLYATAYHYLYTLYFHLEEVELCTR
jgi:hypothetical protein